MRKGYILEKEIDKVLKVVGRLGYHAHKNHPQRTVDGTYIEGEPFDYEVFLPDGIDVFDAKEVSGKWHMKEKDLRQCNNFMQCAKAGCRAYFLILFDKERVRKLDAATVSDVLRSGSKTITEEIGEEWDMIDRLKELNKQPRT